MPAPGAVLAGRYRIIAPLGAGGMATVHRARDERLDRDVAVKILLPNHAGDPVLAARFEREARSLAAAAHPGVVAVFDVDPGDPAAGVEPFFVMELCDGGSLADRLAGGRSLAPDELIPILVSVADGLAGLHARGVVHRDVKPSNILVAPARAKLADFGLARSDDPRQSSDLTAPGTAVGTMGYLAPDVLAGGSAGPSGDIYALAVACFVGLTGSMPHRAGSIAELVASAGRHAPLVSSIAPDLGTAFDEPISAALDPDPAKRPDALSLGASLTTALGRWSRARARPVGPAFPAAVDVDASTAVVPLLSPAGQDDPFVGPGTAPRGSRTIASRGNAIAAAVLAGLLVVIVALANRPAVTGPGAGAPASGGAAAGSGAVSPSPSAPAATPTASPTSVPTPTVAARALAALDEVDAAIAAIRNSDDLKNKDVNELERRASDIRSALENGDTDAATRATEGLASHVDDLGDEVDEDRAQRLGDAVAAVLDILRDG